jgi:glycosyltransferase involved in cell wall biosynthesis
MIKESLHSLISHSVGEDYELMIMDRIGVLAEINRGFRESRGDYIVFFSNDLILEGPWLDRLAIPNTITSFLETVSSFDSEHRWKELDASLLCVPRNIFEQIGEWDLAFEGGYGYADNDFLYRARALNIPLQAVPIKVRHLTSQTYEKYPELGKNEVGMGRNHDYLLKKHKLGPYRV